MSAYSWGWCVLLLAVILEVIGTSCLKASHGLTRPLLSVVSIGCYVASVIGLAVALKSLDVSVAYAVWAGLGIVCIAVIGVLVFGETMTLARLIFISFILVGVVGLNLLQNG